MNDADANLQIRQFQTNVGMFCLIYNCIINVNGLKSLVSKLLATALQSYFLSLIYLASAFFVLYLKH